MNRIIHPNSEHPSQNHGHILVVSCPFQGHAAPLMKLAHLIIKLGAKVTFLAMNSTYARMTALTMESEIWNNGVRILLIPDGLEHEDDRKDQEKLYSIVQRVVPGYLENLLKNTNQSLESTDRITGVILDTPLAWTVDIPKKIGIKVGIFWSSTPGCLALGFKIPQLIESKIISNDGTPLKNEKIELLPNMPGMATTDFLWYFPGDVNIQKSIFHLTKDIILHLNSADWILGNWFLELDLLTSSLSQNLFAVGPLLADGQFSGSFCSEDDTCLTWLDKQPRGSVVYVAFGSTSRFSQQQLDELASGLELLGRPFLWVAWSGLSNGLFPTYTKEFTERVAGRGKVVDWAPQEVVLGHPSTACFISHCGWSSFMESLSMGVPLFCWPYFADQFYTQKCICDAWKVGMSLERDDGGIIWRHEIKQKVDQLLCHDVIRENASRLKGMARKSISKGGSSMINLEYVLQQMKL